VKIPLPLPFTFATCVTLIATLVVVNVTAKPLGSLKVV
jgi:hypothetical protein